MGFDGVLADEEAAGDLAVAEALSDEAEDFELARGDAEGVELGLIEGEGGWRIGGDEDFAEHDLLAGFGELDAEPDAEDDKDDSDDGAIDFEGVLDDEELVLEPAENGDEDAADEAEDEDVAEDAALHLCWVDFTAVANARANLSSSAPWVLAVVLAVAFLVLPLPFRLSSPKGPATAIAFFLLVIERCEGPLYFALAVFLHPSRPAKYFSSNYAQKSHVKPPNHLSPWNQTTSAWHVYPLQPATIKSGSKIEPKLNTTFFLISNQDFRGTAS